MFASSDIAAERDLNKTGESRACDAPGRKLVPQHGSS
jgi:hypothetical protein